ncbi:uncharacterized protein LOC110032273 [Phalaenopsis equestris]|uniref:uncharacterized protein LOC110032273 n=1 Tax=Phalaenopsis equestris TaxID=78828 RepID=UPI0009E4AE71|nr:uncharacterized protein LOC110032273 [Phalaenopsis equestris]XP_020591506.1 uncharacterized protein LOC110032273 [Phalaenopsis equestris]
MEINGGKEIEELKPAGDSATIPDPNPNPELRRRMVRTKVPEVDIQLFNRGKGPIATFRSSLGGWDQDHLEVQDILDKYGFKTLYSFNPSTGLGVPIRFNPKNGRSILSYTDGSLVLLDGEPKDPLVKPITKFLVVVVLISIVISVLVKDPPDWLKNSKFSSGMFPPWVLVGAVVVFFRLRKRTMVLLKKYVS